MPYDETLAARVRALIAARDAVSERKMFGGVAWMVHGNPACCVLRGVLVGADGLTTEVALAAWVDAGADRAASLPPK